MDELTGLGVSAVWAGRECRLSYQKTFRGAGRIWTKRYPSQKFQRRNPNEYLEEIDDLEHDWEKIVSMHLKTSNLTKVIVPAAILRKNNMGQVDFVFLDDLRKVLWVIEAKKSPRISKRQISRLKASANFLAELFQTTAQLILAIPGRLPKEVVFIKLLP